MICPLRSCATIRLMNGSFASEIRLLATRLEAVGKEVHIILNVGTTLVGAGEGSSKDDDEGLEALVELEKERGYVEAQQQVTTYLSSKVWIPLWDLLAEAISLNRLGEFGRLPDSCRSDVARDFSHVNAPRQDAR